MSTLTTPLPGPISRLDAKRTELALLSLEIACGLTHVPALIDDLDDHERQRWRQLAAVTAEVALSDPSIVETLDAEDCLALSRLMSTTELSSVEVKEHKTGPKHGQT